jgi:hypothetical protein
MIRTLKSKTPRPKSRAVRVVKRPRWIVRYTPCGARRAVSRYFPTQLRATAFYRRLWKRSDPPEEQSVLMETVPLRLQDLRIFKIVVHLDGVYSILLSVDGSQPFRLSCSAGCYSDYRLFRQLLVAKSGRLLPDLQITKYGWRVLLRRSTDR